MKAIHENLYIAGQISLEDLQIAAQQGITTIINNRPDNEEPGQLNHDEVQHACEGLGIEYIYLPMANGQPLPEGLVDEFKQIVEQRKDQKVLAHCRTGTRCAIIWSIGKVQDGSLNANEAISKAAEIGVNINVVQPLLQSIES